MERVQKFDVSKKGIEIQSATTYFCVGGIMVFLGGNPVNIRVEKEENALTFSNCQQECWDFGPGRYELTLLDAGNIERPAIIRVVGDGKVTKTTYNVFVSEYGRQ